MPRRTLLVLACTVAATSWAGELEGLEPIAPIEAFVPRLVDEGEVTPPVWEADASRDVEGLASWYGLTFHGRRTASGERFDMNALTAAHPTLPFGTRVRVVNKRNGRSVVVRINDRGPHVPGRIIDLSHAAARTIGILGWGAATVVVSPLPAAQR